MSALGDIQIYNNRTATAWCRLDERHFECFNRMGDMLTLIGGGCLDAPEQLPAGSMRGYGKRPSDYWTAQSVTSRDEMAMTQEALAYREALAEWLIKEILAEEST